MGRRFDVSVRRRGSGMGGEDTLQARGHQPRLFVGHGECGRDLNGLGRRGDPFLLTELGADGVIVRGEVARRPMLRLDGDLASEEFVIEERYGGPEGQHPNSQHWSEAPDHGFLKLDHAMTLEAPMWTVNAGIRTYALRRPHAGTEVVHFTAL